MPMVVTQGGGQYSVNKESVKSGKIFEFISLKKFSQVYSKIIYMIRWQVEILRILRKSAISTISVVRMGILSSGLLLIYHFVYA